MKAPEIPEPRPRIAIVDHDMGNRQSVYNAVRKAGADPVITRDQDELRSAASIVLPGVGAFPAVMEKIHAYGLDREINRARLSGKPILGICLGHQMLFEASEEHGLHKGLGFIPGVVKPVPRINIGWRRITFVQDTELNKGMDDEEAFYHLHSFAAVPDDDSVVFAQSPYPPVRDGSVDAGYVVGAVQQENLYGVQFHPEKSGQDPGIDMLRNFVRISREFEE